MQRRSFLKILAGAACAIAAGVELSLTESLKPQLINGIHPDWLYAKFEEAFIFASNQVWHDRYRDAWLSLCNA